VCHVSLLQGFRVTSKILELVENVSPVLMDRGGNEKNSFALKIKIISLSY